MVKSLDYRKVSHPWLRVPPDQWVAEDYLEFVRAECELAKGWICEDAVTGLGTDNARAVASSSRSLGGAALVNEGGPFSDALGGPPATTPDHLSSSTCRLERELGSSVQFVPSSAKQIVECGIPARSAPHLSSRKSKGSPQGVGKKVSPPATAQSLVGNGGNNNSSPTLPIVDKTGAPHGLEDALKEYIGHCVRVGDNDEAVGAIRFALRVFEDNPTATNHVCLLALQLGVEAEGCSFDDILEHVE